MNDRQRLEAIVAVVCRYLPPDGISREDAMSEIIGLVDPLPEIDKNPVAWQNKELPMEFYEYEHLDPMWYHHYRPLYAAPRQNEWVDLPEFQIKDIVDAHTKEGGVCNGLSVALEVQMYLKERNK